MSCHRVSDMKFPGLVLVATLAMAGEPGAVDIWHGGSAASAARPAGPGLATSVLAKYGNHSVMVIRREQTAQVELHETQADIVIVESGSAELRTGGTMPGAKTVSPHELRSEQMAGGMSQPIAPGDVIHIPANVAHQVVLSPGETIAYMAIKVDAR